MIKLLLLGVLLEACAYAPRFDDCTVRCDEGACPGGLACGAEGLCRLPGSAAACAEAAPSCADLSATCGPGRDESCCSTGTPIPGGSFYRGYDAAPDAMYGDASFPAKVSPFVLDRFEVTVGRFRKFVDAGLGTSATAPLSGEGAHAQIAGSGWDASWSASMLATTSALTEALACDGDHQTWTDVPTTNETRAQNCVTWFEAAAFCSWDGGFLPTETEWNFAAAGGDEQRAYPWSAPAEDIDIDCSLANYSTAYPDGFCAGSSGDVNPVGMDSPHGDGRWGHADLGGNLDEWTLDASSDYSATCDDCAVLTSASARRVRGGDWANAADTLRTAFRNYTSPSTRDPKIGFRCARTLQ